MVVRIWILVAVLSAILGAQTTTVEIVGVTPTQAVVHVTAVNTNGTPFSSPCSYRISEGSSFSSPVNDVNPALFSASNSDARTGSIINGKDHFLVAGSRIAAKATDQKFYSRALQADTTHWIGVTCGTAPEKSATFKTQNPPLGNSYPEFPAFDATAFGNRATPTIDFTDKSKTYIDPLTGILLKRLTSPLDYVAGGRQHQTFSYARDVNGSAWTNTQAALTNQVSTTLAAISTPNAPLFLAWAGLDSSNSFDSHGTVNDVMLRAYCKGTNGAKLQACVSVDSGQSCATAGTVEIACPSSAGEITVPASYPAAMFAGWGTQTTPLTKVAVSNGPLPYVWVSGNHVLFVAGYVPFQTERAAGSKLLIPGTAPTCANSICTVSSLDNPNQITIAETLSGNVGGGLLTSAASSSATSLAVSGSGYLYPGHHLVLEPGTSNAETLQVTTGWTAGSTTITLVSGLTKAHAAGALAYWGGGLDDTGLYPAPNAHATNSGALAGATSITVTDQTTGIAPGMTIRLDLNNPTQEDVTVANTFTIGSLTIPLTAPLVSNHIAGSWVTFSTSVTMQDYGAGVRVWLENTGGSPTASASFTFDNHYAEQFFGASNAEFDTCSTLLVNDINTDAAGNALPAPLSGYLCSFSGQTLLLWIPATGETRLLSTYWQPNVGRMQVPTNPFSSIDPKTLFASNSGNKHLYKATLSNPAGVYREYVPGPTLPPAADSLVWTDLTISSSPMEQQLQAYGGPAATAFATGLFPPLNYVGLIGGYLIYDTSTAQDGPCIKVRALAENNQLVQAFDSWDVAPLRWGGCHSAPLGTAGLLNLTMNPIQDFNSNAALGGPFDLHILQMKRGGAWSNYTVPISAASNSNPVTFTSVAHGIDPWFSTIAVGYGFGATLTIAGGTGSWAAVNGTWTATVTRSTPDTFTIPVDTSALGPLTGSLTFTTAPALIHSLVTSISTTTPAVVATQIGIGTEPPNHRFMDGDSVAFGNLPSSQNYFAKVTGFSATTFAVYADQQLTIPVSGATIAAARGGMVFFAEQCPSGLPASVTSQLLFDSPGAVGARCFTVRVQGEPCSMFATPAEHAAYPCKADPANIRKSSLSDMQVGDNLRDQVRGPYDETFVLVRKIKNSETDIEATFMRFYGTAIKGGDSRVDNQSANSHDVGWTPLMVPMNSHNAATGWIDATDPTNTFISADPNFTGAHGDFGYGNGPGLVTYAGGSADHIANKTMRNLLSTPLTYTKREDLPWADAYTSQLTYNVVQSYPGHRQIHAPAQEFRWKGDWNALNPPFGSGQTGGAGLIGGQTIVNIRGGAYDSGSTTSKVYKISNAAGIYDRKRTPTYAWAGKYMFKDKSGPGSLITDADLWNYCVADRAGECRPGSALNDTFIVMNSFYDSGGYCLSNTLNVNAPCFAGANPMAGWAMQMEIDPVDTTARRMRRLTLGLSSPGMQWTFHTWLQEPSGKWGFFSVPYVNGLRNDYFAMKLPPWPSQEQPRDSVVRSTFVPVARKVAASPGALYARARFGYAENGPPTGFFCTSRQEACSTEKPAAAATDPYSFVGEAGAHVACGTGCTITIPAVPGRVVYFVIDRLDSLGNVVHTSPMEAVPVP